MCSCLLWGFVRFRVLPGTCVSVSHRMPGNVQMWHPWNFFLLRKRSKPPLLEGWTGFGAKCEASSLPSWTRSPFQMRCMASWHNYDGGGPWRWQGLLFASCQPLPHCDLEPLQWRLWPFCHGLQKRRKRHSVPSVWMRFVLWESLRTLNETAQETREPETKSRRTFFLSFCPGMRLPFVFIAFCLESYVSCCNDRKHFSSL